MKFLESMDTIQTTSCVGPHLSEGVSVRGLRMRGQWLLLLGGGLLFSTTGVYAQHPEGGHPEGQRPEPQQSQVRNDAPRANQGKIPPPPEHRETPQREPEAERHVNGKINETQHVSHDHWYGHDRPDDKRFHLDHPFEHGHFEHFGASYRYHIERIDRDHHRLWFPGGFYFQIADWDRPVCADWCSDCGDDFVVYEDPDHLGRYMLYNVHTGVYVHASYLGS